MTSKNHKKDELSLNYFIQSYSIKDIFLSTDFLRSSFCAVILLLLTIYLSLNFESQQESKIFVLKISESMLSNTIVIDSSLLGIIIASIAIFSSFSRPELLRNLYGYKKEEGRLHQYILVLFYPAIPAIIGIFFSFVGNVLLIANNILTIYVTFISVFFTFYCIFGVWESIKQISKSIITLAKVENNDIILRD